MTVHPSRKDAREAVVTAIQAGIPGLAAVLGHMPKDGEERSPIVSVESDGIRYHVGTESERQPMRLVVGYWHRRDGAAGSGYDAQADLVEATWNGRF
jgi:hypothetical protein